MLNVTWNGFNYEDGILLLGSLAGGAVHRAIVLHWDKTSYSYGFTLNLNDVE